MHVNFLFPFGLGYTVTNDWLAAGNKFSLTPDSTTVHGQ